MQRRFFNSDRGPLGSLVSRFGAILAMSGLLLLSACDGKGKTVTENNLADNFGPDGIAPTLTTVTIKMARDANPKPDGAAKEGQEVRIDIEASEGLKKPTIFINDVEAEVIGSVTKWYAVREMTASDVDGMITFSIGYEDISGEVGAPVRATTDGSAVQYCAEGCPDAGDATIVGTWKLDGVGAAGVGPAAGDISWWSADEASLTLRDCWFDDKYIFGSDGSFRQDLGDETWLEPFQGVMAESCGTPVAPHDGTAVGTYVLDETTSPATLTINGRGLHLGLAKVVNGADLGLGGVVPDSITYQVQTFDAATLAVTIEAAPGNWWTFRFAKEPESPLLGKWKLDGEGAAGVGPAEGDTSWWSADAAAVTLRDCWFDDVYEFNADGSFRNILGDETWLEPFQGVTGETCGAPVAPHDGSNGAIYQYDEDAGTLTLSGTGAHIGLAKVVNGEELASPGAAPSSITYNVATLDGDNLTVNIEAAADNWWQFNLIRVSTSPLVGKWRLAGEGSAGVGPAAGDTSWWSADAAAVTLRDCWFDDIFHFGDDGTFQNFQDGETWLEPFQGVTGETCGVPVAPHDGSNRAIYQYDEDASTLTLSGEGAHIGLAKVVNGAELNSPSEAPPSVTYNVATLDGDNLTVTIESLTDNWWQFNLVRVSTSPLVGKWRLAGEGSAGVGPAAGDTSWWSADAAAVTLRDCWFDDIFHFGDDGSFQNFQDGETWLEPFQGVTGETCGASVAPHDGSSTGSYSYDDSTSTPTLTISGAGSHLGLAKVVNGAELASPGAAPDSITYDVVTLDGDNLTVTIESVPDNWWTFSFERVNDTAVLVGNWKLDGEGAAGVGPTEGDISWWNADATAVSLRACWFDDVVEFNADGSFANVQGDETWLEPFQGVMAEQCGAPVAPHDGSNRAIFQFDEGANTLKLSGTGAHLGLPKTVNGADLAVPSAAPEFVTYNVATLDGDTLTVTIESAPGNWWQYRYTKVSGSPLVGNWKLDGEGAAGVGPASGDTSWWAADAAALTLRDCWFDDVFHFGDDGSFQNFVGDATWLEPFQGVTGETCGAPVAPHDGSSTGTYSYDDSTATPTLTISGVGSHLGHAKVVNGAERASPGAAPDSITDEVLTLDDGTLAVTIETTAGNWWTFRIAKE